MVPSSPETSPEQELPSTPREALRYAREELTVEAIRHAWEILREERGEQTTYPDIPLMDDLVRIVTDAHNKVIEDRTYASEPELNKLASKIVSERDDLFTQWEKDIPERAAKLTADP